MHLRWPLALLPLLCFAMWSCDHGAAGKVLAGGPGSASQFDIVPPIPSVPVAYGTYVVQITQIITAPLGLNDRFAALGDSTTIVLAAGPSSNTISIGGAYIDPRIDDSILLTDRGLNSWSAQVGFSGSAATLTLTTNAAGFPITYSVATLSTSTLGAQISSTRIRSNFASPPGAPVGLWMARVNTSSNASRPPLVGDFYEYVMAPRGLAQWEQDDFQQAYFAVPGGIAAQFTTYSPTRTTGAPPNIEFYDMFNAPLFTTGTYTETEHEGQTTEITGQWFPISPINTSGNFTGKVRGPNGLYQSFPYILVDNVSDMLFTVAGTTVTLTVGTITNAFIITRLDTDRTTLLRTMTAYRKIDAATYEKFTLTRNVTMGTPVLANSGCRIDVQTYRIASPADIQLGSYFVSPITKM